MGHMSIRIGVCELRQHASRYLALVKEGARVEITERGRLVAVLAPPDPDAQVREELVAAGQLEPGTGGLADWTVAIEVPSGTESPAAVLGRMRAAERDDA